MRTPALLLVLCPFLSAQQFTNGAPPALVPNMEFLRPGDVDGDGVPDLLGITPSQILRFSNDGFGRFAQPQAMAAFQAARTGAIADFDGDGDGDLVTWTDSNNFSPVALHLLTNQGASFSNQLLAQSTLQWDQFVVAIDFDGDGDRDVFAASYGGVTYRLLLLENNGTGQFTDVTATMLPFDNPTNVGAAHVLDVDGDGRTDILLDGFAAPGSSGGGLGILRNTAAGFVDETATRLPPLSFVLINDVTIGDLEGDGDPDILAVEASGTLRLLENQSGVYANVSASLPAVSSARRAVFFDADRDGLDDVYVLRVQSPEGQLLRNIGGTLQPPQPAPKLQVASNIGLAPPITGVDLDADGDDDVFGWRSGIAALRNDSSGGLTEWWQDTRVGSIAAHGDVDNDGDLDWVGVEGTAFNDGFGGFDIVPVSHAVGIDLGDIDGDNDLDVVGNGVFLNDGTGTFTATSGVGYPSGGGLFIIRQVRLADFDGDNDLDIAALGLIPSELSIYTNNGTGQFTHQNTFTLPLSMQTLEIGDVDGDQDIDLLIGGGAGVIIATNTGGTFGLSGPLSIAGRARVADLQGNGQPDIIIDEILGGTVRVLRPQGGFLLDVTSVVIPSGTTETSVAIGDIDNDGDVDLAGAGVLRNVNGTLATEAPTLATGQFAEHLVDFDGDGDRDLVAGGFLHHNREHQVELPRPAVVGLNLRVDVWALPGRASAMEFAFVGVGTSRTLPGVALPPWGDVQIGGVLGLVNVPITPGVGAGGFDLPIPANAGLVGMELAFQCLHLGPSAELLGAAVSTFIEN